MTNKTNKYEDDFTRIIPAEGPDIVMLRRDAWPEDYKWRLQLAPKTFYECETAPCWFHRVMLKLVLGFTWRRINTTKDTNDE